MIFTIGKSVMVLFSAGFFKRGLAAMYTSRFPESFPAGYKHVVMLAVGKMLKYKRCMLIAYNNRGQQRSFFFYEAFQMVRKAFNNVKIENCIEL